MLVLSSSQFDREASVKSASSTQIWLSPPEEIHKRVLSCTFYCLIARSSAYYKKRTLRSSVTLAITHAASRRRHDVAPLSRTASDEGAGTAGFRFLRRMKSFTVRTRMNDRRSKVKFLSAAIVTLTLMASSMVQADETKMNENVRMVAPALEKYTQGTLLGDVWKRPGLSARDRSIITIAALIARNQTIEMSFYLNLALDSGVKPREISEVIAHLAFYSGWANAMSGVAAAKN